MHRIKGLLAFSLIVGIVPLAVSEMKNGNYRIENISDGLHITTEGGNAAFARIVGENWQNFGEQKWNVEKSGPKGYFLSPEKYRTNNALSYFRDPAQKYPIPQRWALIPVRDGYQIQNLRTELCLISSGRRREILEGKCDLYLRDRHWRFTNV
ncbi:hypothetical protein Ocin01_00925 [Orchesella cincta]|uniref:Ricin B lectin domain-containing protein n=1 Tax=Orchesella cincta TaxID=48709 RepID=A0A1D2NKH1_ORCCI|nr:hypothetical protein Ocin01_00925 [Orchesella cincta]